MTSLAAPARVDPILVDVFWTRLTSLVNAQDVAMRRSAFSPIVREAADCSIGIFDTRGNLVVQAVTSGAQGQIFGLPAALQHALRRYPLDQLAPGDVLITNEPYSNSGHQYDVTVITPVFAGDRPVAIYASVAHVGDIGGLPAMSVQGKDVFEGGLILPVLKLYSRGVRNDDVYRIIESNVRLPVDVIGDINAMVGATEVGSRRLVEFLTEVGLGSIEPIADEIFLRCERAMRAAIAAVPDGTYEGTLDTDGIDEPIRLAVRIDVRGDEMSLDFSGTSPISRFSMNVPFTFTRAYATYAVKCALTPEIPNNQGSLRSLRISAPDGCILNAKSPAGVAMRHVLGQLVPDAVLSALAKALPGRVIGQSIGGVWFQSVSSLTGASKPFQTSWLAAGGMGARPNKDGLHCVGFPTALLTVSTEVIEHLSPLRFRRREMLVDSGGPGRFRGGCGQLNTFEVTGDAPVVFLTSADRLRFPPQGIIGGRPGGHGRLSTSTGPLRSKEPVVLEPGVVVDMYLPGGGGYGDPRERDRDLVAEDVLDGFVSRDAAEHDYGVRLDAAIQSSEGGDADKHRSGGQVADMRRVSET